MSRASRSPNDDVLFKLVDRDYWESHTQDGFFDGSEVDLADGFIHFSNAQQLPETAQKHFQGQQGLLLVAVESKALGSALRYEASRNDELFGHLYAKLNTASVAWVRDFSCAYCDPRQTDCDCDSEAAATSS